jgi:hypothetical protein
VEIDKETVLSMLRERGQTQEANQAEQELPARVDPERDAGMLEKFGLDPGDLLGGTDIPGL